MQRVLGNVSSACVMSPIKLLAFEDPVYAWCDRLLDAFDGYARNALGYAV